MHGSSDPAQDPVDLDRAIRSVNSPGDSILPEGRWIMLWQLEQRGTSPVRGSTGPSTWVIDSTWWISM